MLYSDWSVAEWLGCCRLVNLRHIVQLRFGVLAHCIWIMVFRDVMSCCLLKTYQHFILQSKREPWWWRRQVSLNIWCLPTRNGIMTRWLEFDWSATAARSSNITWTCALVVPHISAACTTVTRLHGVTSQNRAIPRNNCVTTCSSARHLSQFCIPVSYIQAADFKTGVLKGIATYIPRSCIKLSVQLLHQKCSIETHCSHLRHTFAPVSICKMNISCLSSTAGIYAILGANCTSKHWMTAFYVNKCRSQGDQSRICKDCVTLAYRA